MEKQILQDYVDACAVIKDTEEQIRKLEQKKKTIIQDSVKGSNPDFPYQAQNFVINGSVFNDRNDCRLQKEEKLLKEQQARAEAIKEQVEQWMTTVPMRMQRIIRYKIFNGLTWEETARKLGRKGTGESVRKELNCFMRSK